MLSAYVTDGAILTDLGYCNLPTPCFHYGVGRPTHVCPLAELSPAVMQTGVSLGFASSSVE